MPNDRRRFIRFPFHSRAEVQFRGMACTGTLKDISLSGALFLFDQPPEHSPFLRPCRLHIHYLEQGITASFNGLAVLAKGSKLGVKFIAVGEKERLALLDLIELNLAEPALLDRDVPTLLKSFELDEEEANEG
jgi:hypothetical protein